MTHARPIAVAEKCRARTAPRGSTVAIAPQWRHRYRRTCNVCTRERVPGCGGPRSCRARSPWPTRTRGPPTGRPAAPHAGQHAGRQVSTSGVASAQNLTSTTGSTTTWLLRSSKVLGARREAARQDLASRHSFCDPHKADAPPPRRRPYSPRPERAQSTSVRDRPPSATPRPSHSRIETKGPSLIRGAR